MIGPWIEQIDIQGGQVHPSAIVEHGAVVGEGTRIWHFAHIRTGARIGRDCIIGKDCYVDAGAVVGDRVKIQNGVSVYRGVTLEDEVFVGPHAVFTNDLYPRSVSPDWKVTPTLVHYGASIGANATILCGLTLGAYCMVGAGSVVTANVGEFELVRGNPARLAGWVCRCGRSTTHPNGAKVCRVCVGAKEKPCAAPSAART